MKNNILSRFITGIFIAGSTLLSTCIGFLSNTNWRLFLENRALTTLGGFKITTAAILFPLILLIDYAKVGFAAWKIYQDKKATPNNISHLIIEVIKAALTTPAILAVIGLIALPGLVTPILFVTVMSIGALHNIALTSLHAWHWLQATSGDEADKHKLLTLKYGSAALTNTLLAVGVGLILLGGLAAGPLLAVGMATAGALLVGGIVASFISYKVDKTLAETAQIITAIHRNQSIDTMKPLLRSQPSSPRREADSTLVSSQELNKKNGQTPALSLFSKESTESDKEELNDQIAASSLSLQH